MQTRKAKGKSKRKSKSEPPKGDIVLYLKNRMSPFDSRMSPFDSPGTAKLLGGQVTKTEFFNSRGKTGIRAEITYECK